MRSARRGGRQRATWATLLLLCALLPTVHAAEETQMADAGAYLDQTEALRNTDYKQFVQHLARIHRESSRLTKVQQAQLLYLDAQKSTLDGDYAAAESQLERVVSQSSDPILVAKASAALMNNLATNHRYEDAFKLAHQLTLDLPRIQDRATRFRVLGNLSQMLNFAGEPDLAIKYAHMMEDTIPEGMNLCYPRAALIAALWSAKRLKPDSPELHEAAASCIAAHQPLAVNTAKLIASSLYLGEKKPSEALAMLDRMADSIRTNHYHPHELSAQVQRAEAYELLGNEAAAKRAALAAVSMASAGESSDYLAVAYGVLYRIAKRSHDPAQALAYYELYVAQNKSSVDDAAAQALAYQTVQQQVLTRQLEAEELNKQNSLLRLQRALDAKAAETSRLYITLLIITLAAIALWLFRTLHLQQRFKRMATRDGLTGIYNHQHFMSECSRRLRLLHKRPAQACLIWIDLDHFKQINDTHGHAIGDAALRHSVAICQHQLRPGDLLGRLGGEEFGVLMADCPREQGIAIADRIRLAIESHPLQSDGASVSISASIGVACTSNWGHDLQQLCRAADAALYRAKRAGRNRVVANVDERAVTYA